MKRKICLGVSVVLCVIVSIICIGKRSDSTAITEVTSNGVEFVDASFTIVKTKKSQSVGPTGSIECVVVLRRGHQ